MSLKTGTPIDPGRLDKILRIEEVKKRDPDGAGGYSNVWAPIPLGEEVWGALEPLRGAERIRAMQQRSNATHEVTIRWLDHVTSQCRVIWNDSIYEITEPPRSVPDTRDTHLIFQVRQEPNEARSVMRREVQA